MGERIRRHTRFGGYFPCCRKRLAIRSEAEAVKHVDEFRIHLAAEDERLAQLEDMMDCEENQR